MNFTITRKNGGVIAWTEEQVCYIVEKYNDGMTIVELSSQFQVSSGSIRNLLRKQKVVIRGKKNGYPRNENFFKEIDTKEKAYWLGFLYVGGSLGNGNSISVSSIDLDHIEKFKQAIGATNHKIQTIADNYCFSIKDKELFNSLVKLGCAQLLFPSIKKDLIFHFIRGYFDRNGDINFLEKEDKWSISLKSPNKDFLYQILRHLNRDNIKIQKPKHGNCYVVQINGKFQLKKSLDVIYKDSDEAIRLNRKYDKYLQFNLSLL